MIGKILLALSFLFFTIELRIFLINSSFDKISIKVEKELDLKYDKVVVEDSREDLEVFAFDGVSHLPTLDIVLSGASHFFVGSILFCLFHSCRMDDILPLTRGPPFLEKFAV